MLSRLEEELKHQLATAYLICRVVDNIEDCTEPHSWQAERFAEFEQLLHRPADSQEILRPGGINRGQA